MPSKRRRIREDEDDLAWETSEKVFDTWEATLYSEAMCLSITSFILKYRKGEAAKLHTPIMGGCNVFWRLEYKDGSSAGLRVPAKGLVQFPEEKVRYEVATMRYVATHTTIPVPKVYHYGPASENLTGLGPFMIIEYIDHERTLSHALTDPTRDPKRRHLLDPNITEERLEFLYRQMVDIVLQLSTLAFPRIGSLLEDEEGNISVTNRPLIMNMDTLSDHASIPPWIFPSGTFSTDDEWYSALADMHMAQLVFQHNDAVRDGEDARDKYVARQLFRRLAAEGRLSRGLGHKSRPDGSFRLWSEDLRPSNVLVDKDDRVVGVIDWEFAYVAPSQFTFDPPWWLLLMEPDGWEDGAYPEWMEAYEPRLQTFLRILEEAENRLHKSENQDQGRSHIPLAQRMRESWETKSWMVNFAARKTWCFDALYWRYLDPAYFGHNEDADHKARLGLLSKEQLDAMEPFVQTKVDEAKDRILIEWKEDESRAYLAKVML